MTPLGDKPAIPYEDRAEILENLAKRNPARSLAEQVEQQRLMKRAEQIRSLAPLFQNRVGERVASA